jgi:hypothetical protein
VTPHIHYVSSEGDLSVVTEKFSCAFSSHCIEHQPDLIRHLNQVEDLLDRSGKYYLIVPDKRYCFDCVFSETTLDEIEQAHKEKRRRHSVQAIIEHRAYVSHNDPFRHWVGDHWDADYESKREAPDPRSRKGTRNRQWRLHRRSRLALYALFAPPHFGESL